MNTIKTIINEEVKSISEVKDAVQRLKSKEVAYMELKESTFSCSQCIFFKDGYCTNKKILAIVSPKGCCNLYLPAKKDEKPSEDWQVTKK